MKVLLIGGGGFVGTHLQDALRSRDHEVTVADLPALAEKNPGIEPVDLERPDTLEALFSKCRPDRVFLLAAVSSVAYSWKNPDLTVRVNVLGAMNVLSALQRHAPGARLIYIGSGEEYGVNCSEEHPFTEDGPCLPINPYAVTKFAAGRMLELLTAKSGTDFVHLRPFNHFGPGQRTGFVFADFCHDIVEIERGLRPPVLRVGNLEAKRDFLFVDDVIDAYVRIAEAASLPRTVYNLSTGSAHSIREMLDILIGLSNVAMKVEIDPAKFRPQDIPVLVASGERAYRDFDWRPQNSLVEALTKTLNWWREKRD